MILYGYLFMYNEDDSCDEIVKSYTVQTLVNINYYHLRERITSHGCEIYDLYKFTTEY